MRLVTPSGIARVAYEATRTYCRVLGREGDRADWQRASPQERRDALVSVEAVLSGQASSGAHLHATWLQSPSRGIIRTVMVTRYDQLPVVERRQLLLFRAVVLALVDGPCLGYCHDDQCGDESDHDCHLDTCVSRFGVPPGLWRSLFAAGARDPDPMGGGVAPGDLAC
jgi:hypothetical protein